MPKELTHWIIAERALERVPPVTPLGEMLRSHRKLYLAGAVLPDTLLHLVRGHDSQKALSLAHRFHDPADNSYAPLIRAEELHGSPLPPPLLACFLGVLCHMQADIILHPFVYARSGTGEIAGHYRIETSIDMYFQAKGIVPPVKRLDELVTPETGGTLLETCSLLFDPDQTLPPRSMNKALRLHCHFQALYGSMFWRIAARILGRLNIARIRQQQHLFYPVFAGKTELNLLEGKWRHPVTGEIREESVDNLAERAVLRTVDLIEKTAESGLLGASLAITPGENLLTGLHGVQQKYLLSG